ncbi:MAG TPA: amidohydrolase family protein, partial [Bryobacteraceae bacterium]|nr:amidohydrolase family protein [Bryobacteraceae bacterium]
VRTPKEAREAFDRYYDERVDFIKVLNLSPAAFEALAEASRHNGIPFAGDLPPGVSAFTAAQDRMVSMEHLFGVGLACSRRENELRNEALAGKPVTAEMMKSYDPEAAAALWDLFRRYDVRQCPTLAFWSRMTGGVRAGGSEPGLRYIEASIRKKWTDPGMVGENPDLAREEYAFALRLTRDMAKAGVPILAGTDTGTPWTVPGIELHRELALLVKAGLSPAQALRSATSEPARLMRREKEIGYVRKGYAADLVVLTANPLIDIDNTRRIDTVVVRGRQMNRLQLNQMLQRAAAQASKT